MNYFIIEYCKASGWHELRGNQKELNFIVNWLLRWGYSFHVVTMNAYN